MDAEPAAHQKVEQEIDRISPTRRPPGSPVMYQRWAYLLFLHWEVPESMLRPLVPPELTIDTFDGKAYIGLVPFTMTGVRPVGLPAVPGISNFHETNVRTYVHHRGKDPGVWFFSLDAAQRLAVKLAQWFFKLPYHFARMSLKTEGGAAAPGAVRYFTERLWPGPTPASCQVDYEVDAVQPSSAAPGTLEHFLVERYILFAKKDAGLKLGRVHHVHYPLQPARVRSLRENLIAAAGITRPDTPPPLVHYASEVQVDIYGLEDVT
jgi:hypothetical protein